MARNKIEDLRNHLFEMIETLKDPDESVDMERVKLINEMCQTVINSAKVEVDFLKATGNPVGTGFIQIENRKP